MLDRLLEYGAYVHAGCCWQDPSRYKSLISFGEVLDPASKAAVLGIDSQVQMRGMINSELQVRRTQIYNVPQFSPILVVYLCLFYMPLF